MGTLKQEGLASQEEGPYQNLDHIGTNSVDNRYWDIKIIGRILEI
jgi:hypothetical protein